MGKLMGQRAVVVKFVYADSSWCLLSLSSDKSCLPLPGTKEDGTPPQREMYILLLGRKGEGRELLSHLLILNNLFANVVYFEVVYPDSIQLTCPHCLLTPEE